MPDVPTYEDLEQRIRELEDAVSGYKKSHAFLKKKQESERPLIHRVQAGVVVHDFETRIVDCNSKAQELLGLSKEQMMGKNAIDPHWKFLDADGEVMPLESYPINKVLADRQTLNDYTVGVISASGLSSVWLSVNAVPVFDDNGDIEQVVVTFVDITERKKAEAALRESEMRFEKMLNVVPDMISVHSPEMDILYSNWAGFAAVPESRRILNTKCYRTYRGFDDICPDCQAMSVIDSRRPFQKEIQLPDGKWMDLRIIPILDENNHVEMFMEWVRDITDRKEAMEALRESELRFRELAELLPETIFEMDLNGTLTFVNQKAFEKFGYTKEEFKSGLNVFFHMVSDDDRTKAKKNFKRIAGGEKIGLNEYKAMRKDGTTFPALFHSTAIQKDEKIAGLRGFIVDITKEKKIEDQLKQSHKMEALGTLAGGIAHDFNNILGIIVGNTELAMLDIPKWSPAQNNFSAVREAALRARDLVTQILLFARRKEHHIVSIRVEPIAKESLKMLRSSIPKTVEMKENIRENLPSVPADPAQIQQIIMNLCTNAAQVMEAQGGTLTLSMDAVEVEYPLDTSTGRVPQGRYVRIQVCDTGPGIPDANIERIFEPFFTTKGVGEGTGLGLAVVHGIVQDRQGGILVESGAKQGTTFSVYLPVAEVGLEEAVPEAEQELPRGTETVLFVDDEPMMLEFGKLVLERQGYQVEARTSGKEALECFRSNPDRFDLVLTDMTMPGIRGDKLAEEVMKLRSDIPVILSTGYSKHISAEKAKEIGIRAFLMKPLTAHELVNEVRHVLNEKE